MDGALIIDKPEGWTSHDVVNRARRLTGTRSVGHLGTLDPIATGVLPLLIGNATRLARYCNLSEKTYEAVIRFGFATNTYDRAGEPVTETVAVALSRELLEPRLDAFRGEFLQTPPPVSAKKVNGVPAYKLARQQEPVALEPVPVTVFALDLLDVEAATARIRVRCSAGTYIRAIAHELGAALACGAHIAELRRTAAGDFTLAQAHTLEELETVSLQDAVIPAARLLPAFPPVVVDFITAAQIRNGRDFAVSPFLVRPGSRHVKAVSDAGSLIAIGEAVLPNLYHPVTVFPA